MEAVRHFILQGKVAALIRWGSQELCWLFDITFPALPAKNHNEAFEFVKVMYTVLLFGETWCMLSFIVCNYILIISLSFLLFLLTLATALLLSSCLSLLLWKC